MHHIIQNILRPARSSDRYVLWITLGLSCFFGVVSVYSASSYLTTNTEGFLLKQLIRIGLALGLMGIFSRIDYHLLARWSKLALMVMLGLLVIVLIDGVAHGGATRWIRLGPIGFQPSDIAKVALILHVGYLLTKKQLYIANLQRAFLPLCFWIMASVVLIGKEDFSTSAIVFLVTLSMCFVGRVRMVHLGGLVGVSAVLAVILLLLSPGRLDRVESYLGKSFSKDQDEEVSDTQGEGYQAYQAKIAFAQGGLTGRGPGKSIQRDFLPAPYNDFIFAIIAEEYGIAGALFILILFLGLLFRGFLRIARGAPDPLGLFLGVGLTSMVVLYGFVHAGVSCGLFPVTGLPMPFVSYGGTSMMSTGIMVGILLNISRQSR